MADLDQYEDAYSANLRLARVIRKYWADRGFSKIHTFVAPCKTCEYVVASNIGADGYPPT